MLKIAICEDNLVERKELVKVLDSISFDTHYTIFQSGEDLIEDLENSTDESFYDLFLLDIYMTGISGIETARIIRNKNTDVPIAFITSSLEHTLESYRLGALKYIEKPFDKKNIEEIIELALLKKKNIPTLEVKKNKKTIKIPFSKILYLEQNNHTVTIYKNDNEQITVYNKLSTLIEQLDKEIFLQTHKSYIVNLNFVNYFNKELRCLNMANNKNVNVRRGDVSKVKKILEEFYFKKVREF